MSKAKSLTDEQISQIRAWAEAGDGFPEIQKKLRDEFDLRVTYLETRFLLEDLKIELLSTPEPEPEKKETDDESGDAADESEAEADSGSSVKVTVDTVLRPGAIVSGKVDFGGGHIAAWWLDQLGRLGMDAGDSDFRPSEEQVMDFQNELRKAIERSGF